MIDALHRELHASATRGDGEREFCASYGVHDPVGLSLSLYVNTGRYDVCVKLIQQANVRWR